MTNATATKTEITPAIVEIPAGRSVILTIDGKPVLFLKADPVRTRTDILGREYKQYEYCGMGMNVSDGSYSDQFVSGCATTMALKVENLDIENVTAAVAQRYQINWA